MKKLVALFSFTLLFLISVNTILNLFKTNSSLFLYAQTSMSPIYPDGRTNNLAGEQHSYSLILKGNGNSVVLGKINFSNNTDSPLNNYQLEIPGVTPENLIVFQEISTPVCKNTDPNCLQIQIYPYPTKTDYKRLKPTIDGNQVTISLSEEVKVASSSGLVFSYNSPNYTRKILNKYDFKFETPKVKNSIQNLNISVDTDNKSLFLQVDNEKINYDSPTRVVTTSLETGSVDSLRQIVPNIGNGGRVYKTVSNLTPGETAKLQGSYSTSQLALNLKNISIFVAVLIAIILLVFAFLRSKLPQTLARLAEEKLVRGSKNVVLVDFIASTISSLLIFGGVIFLKYALSSEYFSRFINYGSDFVIQMIMAIFILLFFGVVVILPGILLGIKFGWKHLLIYILFEFFYLMVIMVGYTLLFVNYPPEYYPMPLGVQEKL